MLLICCGMPRSGSTLQFNIAWKVAEVSGIGKRVEWRSSNDWANATNELATMLAALDLHVLKMHFPPKNLQHMGETSERVKFLYVHRDIRDVVYSMQKKFKFTPARALQRVEDSLDVEKWLLGRDDVSVLIQSYDLLLNDLPQAIREISNFQQADISEADIAAIAADLGIESAYQKSHQKTARFEHFWRRLNRLLGRKVSFADDELMLHPNHVSEHKGQIGIGEQMLSAEDIAVLRAKFGDRVEGIGYVPN